MRRIFYTRRFVFLANTYAKRQTAWFPVDSALQCKQGSAEVYPDETDTMKKDTDVLADADSLRLIPDDWWAITGTVRGGEGYTTKRYEREFTQWLKNLRVKFVKTDAELLWFYRIENARDQGMEKDEWHIHFVLSGRHIEKQIAEFGDKVVLAKYLETLWPGGANKDIHPYQKSKLGFNEWGRYISKVTPHDKIETFTKFSPGLVKEVRKRRRTS